jgi:hypothetical protein
LNPADEAFGLVQHDPFIIVKRLGFLSLLDPLGWALDVAYEAHSSCDVLLICSGPFDGH